MKTFDLTDDEKVSIREAKADREAGRRENFISLEDIGPRGDIYNG